MNARQQPLKPRGRITPPSRRATLRKDDETLTVDDIHSVIQTRSTYQKKPAASAPAPKVRSQPIQTDLSRQAPDTETLAKQRESLGFDDIPVASHDEVKKENRFFRSSKLFGWKDDLKWAINADRSNPVASKRPARRRPVNTLADAPTPSAKTIDINISFGSLPKPKLTLIRSLFDDIRHFRWTRRTQFLTATLVILLLFALPSLLPAITNLLPTNRGMPSAIAQKPDYKIMLPNGRSADSVSWQRVSPPERDPVFAYSDTIDNIGISVSQQPIPSDFKPNVSDNVATLARNYAATNKLSTDSTQLFVGTSGQGPQSVIFTKNGLLVLIKSSSKVSDTSWKRYVDSLQYSQTY